MRVELDIPLSLREISYVTKSKSAPRDKYISAISTDTREALYNDLFVALTGENESGEKFVDDAIRKGCYALSTKDADGIITVSDTQEALLNLAEYYKSRLGLISTVAVTGSVGKSTTVKFLKKILGEKYNVHTPKGNFNNHLGLPLTIFSTPKDADILVAELGMNHKNEISRLSRCVRPNIGIITSVGTAHIGNLGSRESIALAKLEILDGMDNGLLFLPWNEPLLSNIKNAFYVGRNTSLSSFSLNDSKNGTYILHSEESDIKELRFFDNREHLLVNLAFALSVATALGLTEEEIIKGVGAISEEDIRQRFISLDDFTIFDDSYNASVESISADLKFISSMRCPTGAFLGDVLELGESAKDIHEQIGRVAAGLGIGHLYLFGDYAEDVWRGAVKSGMNKDDIFVNTDVGSPEISINQILSNHSKNEIILFKASHKLRLDKIADLIKKGSKDD